MLSITFVRHGQTDCSLQNSFCGSVDVPLNANGHRMAEAIAESYADCPWVAIFSSPLQRARDTAAPLARRMGLPLQIEDGLREIAYGAWDGMLQSLVEELYPEEFKAWADDPAHVAPPGGETAIDIAERAMAVIDRIRAKY